MTEINSVNAVKVQTAALGMQEEDELSTSTKKELEALGIPVTEGMTEAQAQEKIQEIRLLKQTQNGAGEVGETEILADAKTLAGQIGVVYSENDDTEEILINIANELEAQIDDAENNPQALSTLMRYFNQLKDLDSLYDEIHSVQNKIFTAMDFVAQNNKKELGF